MADSLNLAPQGQVLGARWSAMHGKRRVETRDGMEIALEVIEGAGLKVVREDEPA